MVHSSILPTPLFRVALIAMALSGLLQISARHYPKFHPDLMDGMSGLLLGIFFGGIAVTVWRSQRRTE
jgi:hypothetical protein